VPAFFMQQMNSSIQDQIEAAIAGGRPDVEVWDVRVIGPERMVRVLIEHPDGVDLALCEEVAKLLGDVREQHPLEVSSPGVERPLVRTSHFERALGETVRVRLRAVVDGRRNLVGRLTAADDDVVRLLLEDGSEVTIDRAAVGSSNIVWREDPKEGTA
jgi:ribosome maturation factor RimP